MSLPEITSEKVTKPQKNETFSKNMMQHIDCRKHENYFIDAKGILHKKVIDFNIAYLAIVIPQILIKLLTTCFT